VGCWEYCRVRLLPIDLAPQTVEMKNQISCGWSSSNKGPLWCPPVLASSSAQCFLFAVASVLMKVTESAAHCIKHV
jgi:hypothetical protein